MFSVDVKHHVYSLTVSVWTSRNTSTINQYQLFELPDREVLKETQGKGEGQKWLS